MEQWRLATISFKMWGEISPTKELPTTTKSEASTITTTESLDNIDAGAKKKDDDFEEKLLQQPKRSIGQAEIESAYFKVN